MSDTESPTRDRSASDTPTVSPRLGRIASAILWVAVAGFGGALSYSVIVPGQRAGGVISFAFWYAAPALVLLLSVWALRSSPERRVAAALLLVSMVVSVFGMEALLRAFPARVPGFSLTTAVADSLCPGEYRRQAGCLAATEMGRAFDRRTTVEVIEDLEKQGVDAWPSIDASFYIDPDNEIEVEGQVRLPLSPGIPEVRTVFCNEAGTWVTYDADEYGFNNPVGLHRPGAAAVAVVGDSFVHGWCVPPEQTLVGRMREAGSNALGLGTEGSGPLVQLGIVREYVKPVRPAVVVWVFFEGNDLRDFTRELSHDLLPRYLDPGFQQGLRNMAPALASVLRDRVLELRRKEVERAARDGRRRESARRRRASLAGWVRLTELRSRLRNAVRSRERAHPYDPLAFARVASRMRDDVASWGGTLVFAYMPSRRRFAYNAKANPHRADILNRIDSLGIPVVDLYEPLSAHRDPLSLFPLRVEEHLTADGYEVAARALIRGLQPHPAPVGR